MATNAIQLNGTTQYGKIDNFSAIDALTDGTLTVEMWVKVDSGSVAYDAIFDFYETGGSGGAYVSTENASPSSGVNFGVGYSGDDADGYIANGVFEIDDWVHFAVVYENSQPTRIYRNGDELGYNLQNTPTGTAESWNGLAFWFGRWFDGSDYLTGGYGGFIRIWNTVRTSEQLKQYYRRNILAANHTGLIVNCRFLEGSGAVVDNEATAGEDLDLYNSPTWITGPDVESVEIEQHSFRWRDDDGSESAASWLAALNTGITREKNTNTRLRMLLNTDGDAISHEYTLQFRKQTTGTWRDVEVAGTILSDNFASAYASFWTETTDAGSDVSVVSGELVLSGDADVSGFLYTNEKKVMVGKYAYVKVVDPSNDCAFAMHPFVDPDTSGDIWENYDWYRWAFSTTEMVVMGREAGGSQSVLSTVESLPSTPFWVRIRVDATKVYFDVNETDPDNEGAWTNFYNRTWGLSVPIDTPMHFSLAAWNAPTNGDFTVDDFKLGHTADPAITLSPSTQFADGDATTAQLTAPSGKSTSDFDAGKINETSNPPAALNIDADDYTEYEWCLEASDNAEDAATYEFRILSDGFVVDTITQTPLWTIGSPGTSANSERAAEVKGKAEGTSERGSETTGKAANNSERSGETTGKEVATSERSGEVTGMEPGANSERAAEVAGKAQGTSERSGEITGYMTSNSERGAELTGIAGSNSERAGELTGKVAANSQRGGELTGKAQGTSERAAELEGTNERHAQSERWAEIRGKNVSKQFHHPRHPKDPIYRHDETGKGR